ncbi:protein prenyltransferase alpha subunit repeat-containing protein 1-like isoform X2 [Fagus crenata]
MKQESQQSLDLLLQFHHTLQSDPLIDELGYIHPSQFATLTQESASDDAIGYGGTTFWSRDHKLGISTQIILPLYNAAKRAFISAMEDYKSLGDNDVVSGERVGSEVMKQSKAVLLLSSDFGTAWNSRKLVVTKKQDISVFLGELQLSALVLSCSPKCDQAWSHRRWVIKSIIGKCSTLQEIVGKESELVEKIAERSKMNYRAWNHRCWLVSYMTGEQVLHELKKSRNWAGLHVADNCCFHYRRRLMLRILKDSICKQENASPGYSVEVYKLWKEELDWNEMLIKRYIGREALWLHRRFLSLCWMKHFATDLHDVSCHSELKISTSNSFSSFIDNELHLLNSSSTVPDNDFEDFQAQATYSATYILWLTKQIPEFWLELQEKLTAGNLKTMLSKLCPERSFLWDSLID